MDKPAWTSEYQGVPVLHLGGELDFSMKRELQALLSLSAAPKDCLIVDFSEVELVDSAPLGLLIEIDDRVTSRGGAIAIAAPQPDVRRVFKVAGLFGLLKIFDDIDTAAAYLRVACGIET